MRLLTGKVFSVFYIILFSFLIISSAIAGVLPTGFTESNVVTGLSSPVGMAFLPDGRILVIEQGASQTGTIKIVSNSAAATLLTVTGITTGGERGLLGIAVDPDYPTRPYIYVYYTASGNVAQVARYAFVNNTIDANSKLVLLNDIPDDASNHNGGTLRFGLDKTLYISVGDDADQCDAQNRTLLKGQILRIKVDDTIDPNNRATLAPANNPFVGFTNNNEKLVWAYGLRNPFRFNVHPDTGALFIGDVGSGAREEVDISTGSENFGWPYYEGTGATGTTSCGGQNSTMPIYDYTRVNTSASVIGGVVYKGVNYPNDASLPPEFNGNFFFNDYYSGNLRVLRWNGSSWNLVAGVDATNFGTGFTAVPDWTVGPDGAIYYVQTYGSSGSRIVRIAYSCNNCSGGGGGGDNPPPSGNDSTSSGGSGCGFVKDDGKGQGAKGEGVAFAMMLIITLTGIALIRRFANFLLTIILVLLLTSHAHAAVEYGIAANYPGDAGIENAQGFIFRENFEEASINSMTGRWEDVVGENLMSFSPDKPLTSGGNQSVFFNGGAHLYRRLLPGYDQLYVRFYVKFDPVCSNIHHFVHMGGYNPTTSWPQGGAGNRPAGNERWTTGIEPNGPSWAWDFYSYWMHMRSNPDTRFWGNSFSGRPSPYTVNKNEWISVEFMVKMNNPVSSSNGEQAFWINGEKRVHLGQGFPRGEWIWDGFYPNASCTPTATCNQNGSPTPCCQDFEGFQWRNTSVLNINFLWLLHYVDTDPSCTVKFDDVVAATQYIGPMVASTGGGGGGDNPPPSGSDSTSSGGSGCGFVRDDGKGQGAKGEGVALMIMLGLTLAGMALFKRRLSNIRLHKKEMADI